MKRLMIATVVLGCVATTAVNAQDVDGRKGLTEEQSKQRQSVIQQYDTDGDGVLSKTEQKSLSKSDKKVLAKTGGVGTSKKESKGDKDKGAEHAEGDHDGAKKHDHDSDSVKHHEAKSNDAAKPAKNAKESKGGNGGKGKGGKK